MSHSWDLSATLGEDGLSILIKRLEQHFVVTHGFLPSHRILKPIVSAFSSSYMAPTGDDPILGSSVYIKLSTLRTSRCVVASQKFHGSGKMTWCSQDWEWREIWVDVWLVSLSSLVWSGTDIGAIKDVDEETGSKRDTEFCFMQNFEILSNDVLHANKNDKALNCLTLRLWRTPGKEGQYFAPQEFGLIHFAAIRGLFTKYEEIMQLQ